MQPSNSVDKKTSFSTNPFSPSSSSGSSPVNSVAFPIISLESQSLHPLSEQLIAPFIRDSLNLNRAGMDIIEEVNEVATSVIGSHPRLPSLQQVTVDSVGWNVHLSQQIGNRNYETAMQGRDLIDAHAKLAQKIRKGENDLRHHIETQKLQEKRTAAEVEQAEIELEIKKIELAQLQRNILKTRCLVSLKTPLEGFAGRLDLMQKLENALLPVAGREMHAPSVWRVLYGLAGMGKSELACYFANKHQQYYSLIWWVDSETAESRAHAYRQLATALKIDIDEKATTEEIEKNLFLCLESHPFEKPWLLIFDNVEEKITFPQRGGFILMTAKRKDVAPSIKGCLEVLPFTQKEALQFLQNQIAEQKEEQLQPLIDQLRGYPLALGKAAAYLVEEEMSLQDYLQELNQEDLIQQDGTERYPFSIEKVWFLTFQKLNNQHPFALKWLQLFSYLSPEGIPLDWLQAWLQKEAKLSEGQERQAAQALLKVLRNYALVRYDATSKQLSLHRLLQEVLHSMIILREKTNQDVLQQAIQKEISSNDQDLKEVFDFILERSELIDKEKPETWKLGIRWLPHAEHLLNNFIEHGFTQEELGKLKHAIGRAKQVALDFSGALDAYQSALVYFRNVYGYSHHPNLANLLNDLGVMRKDLGEFKLAEQHHEEALKIQRSLYGNSSERVAITLNHLGRALRFLHKPEKAKQHYEEALDIYRSIYDGQSCPPLARLLNSIGVVLWDIDKIKESKNYYKQSLAMNRILHGAQPHPDTADSLNNLGISFSRLQQHEKARKAYQEALEIKYALYGTEPHPSVSDSLHNLGYALKRLDQLKEAKQNYKKALKILRIIYQDRPHPSVATLLTKLGILYSDLKKFSKAEQNLNVALRMQRSIDGNLPSPSQAFTLHMLGTILGEQKKFTQALPYFEKAVEMRRAIYNAPHPMLAHSLNMLGLVLIELKEYSSAKNSLEEALALCKCLPASIEQSYAQKTSDDLVSRLHIRVTNEEIIRNSEKKHGFTQEKKCLVM
ncbi:tetratricopeptide repeat protein [Neochlamydia sp. S13]|uniref:tetratricopeptide repeat protein n=1 Tax=Neochlamydia sp. S13 TaxID=1353976 RepID=UPI0005AB4BD0|nr:tetratricopeptide repeat protein [Neochlamydia sp. S13]BBI17829.1 hypothetical protein NCS13_1_1634 [Neochlamydia sp. S13]